jgi:hypothetical protein
MQMSKSPIIYGYDNFLSVAEGNKEDVVSMLSKAYQDKITVNS